MSIYVSPSANNYPGLDRGFNQRNKLDPSLSSVIGAGIYIVDSAADVVAALTSIKDFGPTPGEVRIISGGHCYEDFTFQSQTGNASMTKFVLDMSTMQGIYEETINETDYIVVEPGASNWLVQQTLQAKYGVTLPGGSCYSVCAGGHIAGGGYGLLSRLHGLTVDYLAGVEMVVPDATTFKVRTFDPINDADQLDWASRGGGAGHFGVITKYYFKKSRMPLSPERALFISLPVPWSQFLGVGGDVNFNAFMRAYFDACAQMPGQAFALGKFTYMASPTDLMAISLQVVYGESSGHDSAMLDGATIAPILTQADALAVVTDFWTALDAWIAEPTKSRFRGQTFHLRGHPVAGTVALDAVYDLPWIDMTQLLNGSGENQNGKYKSSYIAQNFNLAETTAMHAFLTDTQTGNSVPAVVDKAQTLIQIDSYGLQVNAMDQDGVNTAIMARGSTLKSQYQTYWKDTVGAGDPAQNETAIITWFNAGYNYIHRQAQANQIGFPLWGAKYQGCYFNYPDRQIGVNSGHKLDPGEQYGYFPDLYFGTDVAIRLVAIKDQIDPSNFFSFAQSIPNSTAP